MIPCSFLVIQYRRIITVLLQVMKKAKSSGFYSVYVTDILKVSKFSSLESEPTHPVDGKQQQHFANIFFLIGLTSYNLFH